MNILKIFVLLITSTTLIKCAQPSVEGRKVIHQGKYLVSNTNLQIDSLKLDASTTSAVGTFFLDDSLICFSDKLYAALYRYNLDGELIDRNIGKGNGPKELRSVRKICYMPGENYYLAFDGNQRLFKIDKNSWDVNLIGGFDFGWEQKERRGDAVNCYHLNVMYSPSFRFYQVNDSLLVFPVMATHELFSGYSQSTRAKEYYETGKIFGEFNFNTSKVERVFGKIPAFYREREFLPNFLGMSFDTRSDTIYSSHAADTLIHVYQYPDKLLYTMGYCGQDMNRNYQETKTHAEAQASIRNDSKTYGRFNFTDYIEETGLLFRGYYKGNHAKTDGLQVYRDNNLIADYDVPQHFQLLGYYNEYYYGVTIYPNDAAEYYILYKFKI